MRWFKHMTSSGDDEKLSRLMDSAGLEGYGFWWRVVEIVAGKVDENNDTSVTFSAKKWGAKLGISGKRFQKLAEICADVGIFSIFTVDEKITISFENIHVFENAKHKYSEDWKEIRVSVFERDNYTCMYCGKKTPFPHCDHIIPHSRGGSSQLSNLTTACPSCNLSKGAKTPEEWLQ